MEITAVEYRKMQEKRVPEALHQERLIHWLNKRGIYYELSLSGIFLPNPHTKGSQAYMKQARSNMQVMAKMISL